MAGIVPPVSVATDDAAIPAPIAGMENHDAVLPLELDLQTLVGGEQGVTVERRSSHIVATFSERFLFDSGHSDLKRSVDSLLKKVAFFILEHPELSVEIDGHTDDRPIKSSRFPSNWELSADRATQVAKALVGLGVEPTRLSIKGFGEYRPRYANDSDENRLKNRRVEIQFSLSLAS
jgi:chemotaxis protein MotB